MKLLLDFLPLILFFGSFKYAESHKDWAAAFATEYFGFLVSGGVVGPDESPVLLATIVVMLATLLQALILKLRGKKIDLMLWISLGLVVVLGGATLWFHNETFIKWKPTGLYWAMALTFVVARYGFRHNLLERMLGAELQLPAQVWDRLLLAWVLFFAAMGALNIYVAYHFDTSTWANFKVFGTTALILVFTLAQGFYLSPYLKELDAQADKSASTDSKP